MLKEAQLRVWLRLQLAGVNAQIPFDVARATWLCKRLADVPRKERVEVAEACRKIGRHKLQLKEAHMALGAAIESRHIQQIREVFLCVFRCVLCFI